MKNGYVNLKIKLGVLSFEQIVKDGRKIVAKIYATSSFQVVMNGSVSYHNSYSQARRHIAKSYDVSGCSGVTWEDEK